MEGAGFADVSTLPPGDYSAFSITLLGGEEVRSLYAFSESNTIENPFTAFWNSAKVPSTFWRAIMSRLSLI